MRPEQHKAWISIRSTLHAAQLRVYRYVLEHPGLTRNEIDAGLSKGQPNPAHSRRLAELEAMGLLVRGPRRRCRKSGHSCATWTAALRAPDTSGARRSPRSKKLSALNTVARLLSEAGQWSHASLVSKLRRVVGEVVKV